MLNGTKADETQLKRLEQLKHEQKEQRKQLQILKAVSDFLHQYKNTPLSQIPAQFLKKFQRSLKILPLTEEQRETYFHYIEDALNNDISSHSTLFERMGNVIGFTYHSSVVEAAQKALAEAEKKQKELSDKIALLENELSPRKHPSEIITKHKEFIVQQIRTLFDEQVIEAIFQSNGSLNLAFTKSDTTLVKNLKIYLRLLSILEGHADQLQLDFSGKEANFSTSMLQWLQGIIKDPLLAAQLLSELSFINWPELTELKKLLQFMHVQAKSSFMEMGLQPVGKFLGISDEAAGEIYHSLFASVPSPIPAEATNTSKPSRIGQVILNVAKALNIPITEKEFTPVPIKDSDSETTKEDKRLLNILINLHQIIIAENIDFNERETLLGTLRYNVLFIPNLIPLIDSLVRLPNWERLRNVIPILMTFLTDCGVLLDTVEEYYQLKNGILVHPVENLINKLKTLYAEVPAEEDKKFVVETNEDLQVTRINRLKKLEEQFQLQKQEYKKIRWMQEMLHRYENTPLSEIPVSDLQELHTNLILLPLSASDLTSYRDQITTALTERDNYSSYKFLEKMNHWLGFSLHSLVVEVADEALEKSKQNLVYLKNRIAQIKKKVPVASLQVQAPEVKPALEARTPKPLEAAPTKAKQATEEKPSSKTSECNPVQQISFNILQQFIQARLNEVFDSITLSDFKNPDGTWITDKSLPIKSDDLPLIKSIKGVLNFLAKMQMNSSSNVWMNAVDSILAYFNAPRISPYKAKVEGFLELTDLDLSTFVSGYSWIRDHLLEIDSTLFVTLAKKFKFNFDINQLNETLTRAKSFFGSFVTTHSDSLHTVTTYAQEVLQLDKFYSATQQDKETKAVLEKLKSAWATLKEMTPLLTDLPAKLERYRKKQSETRGEIGSALDGVTSMLDLAKFDLYPIKLIMNILNVVQAIEMDRPLQFHKNIAHAQKIKQYFIKNIPEWETIVATVMKISGNLRLYEQQIASIILGLDKIEDELGFKQGLLTDRIENVYYELFAFIESTDPERATLNDLSRQRQIFREQRARNKKTELAETEEKLIALENIKRSCHQNICLFDSKARINIRAYAESTRTLSTEQKSSFLAFLDENERLQANPESTWQTVSKAVPQFFVSFKPNYMHPIDPVYCALSSEIQQLRDKVSQTKRVIASIEKRSPIKKPERQQSPAVDELTLESFVEITNSESKDPMDKTVGTKGGAASQAKRTPVTKDHLLISVLAWFSKVQSIHQNLMDSLKNTIGLIEIFFNSTFPSTNLKSEPKKTIEDGKQPSEKLKDPVETVAAPKFVLGG